MNLKPDIFAKVHFYDKRKGGTRAPLYGERVGVILKYADGLFDCWLLLSDTVAHPGSTLDVPITLLSPGLSNTQMQPGDDIEILTGHCNCDWQDYKDFCLLLTFMGLSCRISTGGFAYDSNGN